MAMLPVPLQTETRPSDGLAITWVGVSGAIRYGLIIGVQGVPMPDLDVIMGGKTRQFAILGVPARFTGVVDIGTPAGATRQFGLVAYRSDGGIFPISPLGIFPARSAPRDREYHAVVPPALVEVMPTAQPVRSADPSDPWSALEAASNPATPAAPVTFTAPQPSAAASSFTISQPSSTPAVPHTPAPYDPWDVLSQSAAADPIEEEPAAEPIEEESSGADWAQPPSYTEPTPTYSGYYQAPSQSLPVEPEQRDEPAVERIADKPISPSEEPAPPVVEPAFAEPVRFEPDQPAVINEPEPRPIEARPVEAEPIAQAEAGSVEHEAAAPIVGGFAEAASAVRPASAENAPSRGTWTSAAGDAAPPPVRPVERNSWKAADAAIEADQPGIAETVRDAAEPRSVAKAEEPARPAGAADAPAGLAGAPPELPSTAPIADDSGERLANPVSTDAEYRAVETAAAPTPTDQEDRSATPAAGDSWAAPATPAVADREDREEPSVEAVTEKEAATPTMVQRSEYPTTPDLSPAWAPVETPAFPIEPAPAEPEPLPVNPVAERRGWAASDDAAPIEPVKAWPAVESTAPVERRTEAAAPRIAEPAPIEPEPEVPGPPLPADLGALLDEAELYLLPQWADSDAALSLVEQVEREAPGHPRTRSVRTRIESMRSVGAAGSGQNDSTQIAGLLEKAGRSMNDDDYWGAVDYYEQALAEKPEHAEAQVGLAKARLRARWPSQLARAGGDVEALRALGGETDAEAPDLAGQAYAAAFAIQPAPDLLRRRLSAFAHAGYGGVIADTARRAVQVLEESGRILPNPSVTAALEGLEQTAGAGGSDTEAAINRLCDELVGAGQ